MGKYILDVKDIKLMSSLSAKSLRQILRSKTHISLFIAISFLLLCTVGILSIGASTSLIGNQTNFPSSKSSIECSFAGSSLSHCKQMKTDQKSSQVPLASLLMKSISTGMFPNSSSDKKDFFKAITSFLLREHPVLGLDDFIYLSDSLLALQSPEFIDFIPIDLLTNPRTQALVFAPRNDLTRGFVSYLEDNSAQFRSLPHRIERRVPRNIEPCCDDIWAVVTIEVVSNDDEVSLGKDYVSPPMVTIRMDARKVPDTRNHGFNSERHFLRPLPDELLYLLSGFITIQSEIQNYLSVLGYGGMESRSHVFGRAVAKNVLKSSSSRYFNSSFRQQLDRLLRGRNTDSGTTTTNNNDDDNAYNNQVHSNSRSNSDTETETEDIRVQSQHTTTTSSPHHRRHHRVLRTTAESGSTITSSTSSTSPYSVHIPVMFGAMPSSPYPLHSYWHQHSAALTLLLMLLFSLPAILVGSAFLREVRDGQLHALQTLGVTVMACTGAWLIAGAVILTLLGSVLVLVTAPVLGWSALPPVLALVLFGLSLCPLAFLLAASEHREDIYVYLLITVILIFMLPGYVYYDTTFDIHRLVFVEILLSLLSPSATILALRRMFSALALGEPISVFAVSHVSGVPVFVYLLLLLSNLLMNHLISQWFLGRCHRYPWFMPNRRSGPIRHDSNPLGSVSDISKVITLTRLNKDLKPERESFNLFTSVSLTLHRGQLTVLMGKHGAGKSTLLRILAGLDFPSTGSCFIPYFRGVVRDGSPVRAVGYSQQQFTGFTRLTVIEHLNLYNALLPSKPSASCDSLFLGESLSFKTEMRELLTRLDLWHLRKEQ
eukprot:gene12302-25863_t